MTSVLLTRPIAQSHQTLKKLQKSDLTVYIDPLLEIESLPCAIRETQHYQAALLTSSNSIHALKNLNDAVMIFTVGDATAAAVRSVYAQRQILSAGGNGEDLASLVAKTLRPQDGPLLYLSGEEIRYDLDYHVEKQGFKVDRVICYRSKAASTLMPATFKLLTTYQIQWVLFYSRRTAATFAKIIEQEKLNHFLGSMSAIAISLDVAEALKSLSFKQIKTALAPTENDLLKELYDATTS